MAKFLDTTGCSYHLEQIIKNSEERLFIVSPFLKISRRMKELLEDKDRLKIDIRVIYGKNELKPEENNWLMSMTGLRTSYLENLHAKCYMNEKEALITSMNLYEFSQINNNEMGILVTKETDTELYNEIYKEVTRLLRSSEEIKVTVEKIIENETETINRKNSKIKTASEKEGHCIRCGKAIKLNPKVPYCKDCYNIWKKYGDEEYKENYCHICGKEAATSLIKPTCYTCYKKYKNVLEFNI